MDFLSFFRAKNKTTLKKECFADQLSENFFLEHELCNEIISPKDGLEKDPFIFLKRGRLVSEKLVRLTQGQSITTTPVLITSEHVLFLSFSLIEGLNAQIEIDKTAQCIGKQSLITLPLSTSNKNEQQNVTFSLELFSGKEACFCITVTSSKENNAAIGISRFCICRKTDLSKINAITNYKWRLSNEIGHFSDSAYTHSMYGMSDNVKSDDIVTYRKDTLGSATSFFHDEQRQKIKAKLDLVNPDSSESVFGFAHRCLGMLIPLTPPNFNLRAQEISLQRDLSILSICSGAARIEENILKHCMGNVTLTLLDASEDLAKRAAARFAESGHKVRCLVGDINNGLPGEDCYDIIICVSALHHLANLEEVLSQINVRLKPDGEFWSIGEQVGRNGNRLWPEAMKAANNIFSTLPERLRMNAHTKKADDSIPDDDFSIGCFEGIRSEEIIPLLDNFLLPVDLYTRNCFLWRLTDTSYCDNYDLKSTEDLNYLKSLIQAEAMYWINGGKGTELHGVYKRRQIL